MLMGDWKRGFQIYLEDSLIFRYKKFCLNLKESPSKRIRDFMISELRKKG